MYARRIEVMVIAASALVAASGARGYVASSSWPTGNVTINLQLDGSSATPPLPPGGLTDRSTSWNAAIRPSVDAWNAQMTRCQMVPVVGSSAPIGSDNGQNNIVFSSTIFGESFGDRTLAVTLTSGSGWTGAQLVETDLIFNTAYKWDSYRGTIQSSPYDIRRVALHELGHVLGLDHPDEDDPPQSVAAIMNHAISNTETLQADDIAGIKVLYGDVVTVPTITLAPTSQSVAVGGAAEMSVELNGSAAVAETPTQQYAWLFTPAGGTEEYLFTEHNLRIPLGAAQLDDAGSYRFVVETPNGHAQSGSGILAVSPVAVQPTTRLINLSTRGIAGSGNRTMIVGFVISGTHARRILIRAVGPTLTSQFGVPGTLADPALSVVGNSQTLATNNDWGDNGGAASLPPIFQKAGAFSLPSGSRDAALVVNLAPGAYTALVTAQGGAAEGVALVEAYDIDDTSDPNSRLINLSTRAYAGTDSNIMIAGLVITGPGPRTFLVRGAGDSLSTIDPNLGGTTLDDPVLTLVTPGGTVLRGNDDWDSPQFLQSKLRQAFQQLGAFVFTDRQESAMLVTLNPGIYTLTLEGLRRGTGIGLVEVYDASL